MNYLKNTIGGVILGISLLLGIGIVSGTTAQGQYPNNDQYRRNRDYRDQQRGNRRGRNWDGYPNYGGSFELRQTALNAGYNEGVKAGRNDRRRGRNDFQRSSAYRSATKDYNSRLGDRYSYQRYFRDAFENGYADGQRGY
jgi:hypothetical protein